MLILFLLGVALVSMMVFFGFPAGNENSENVSLLLPTWVLVAVLLVAVVMPFVRRAGRELTEELPQTKTTVSFVNRAAAVIVLTCTLLLLLALAVGSQLE